MSDNHRPNGKFAPGNKLGVGNPHAQKVHKLRAALLQAVTETDIYDIVTTLIEQARAGDVASAREVLDRTIGKPKDGNSMLLDLADTDEADEGNPYLNAIRSSPDIALAASDLLRRMVVDASGVRVAPEPEQPDPVDLGAASGPAEPEARADDPQP